MKKKNIEKYILNKERLFFAKFIITKNNKKILLDLRDKYLNKISNEILKLNLTEVSDISYLESKDYIHFKGILNKDNVLIIKGKITKIKKNKYLNKIKNSKSWKR